MPQVIFLKGKVDTNLLKRSIQGVGKIFSFVAEIVNMQVLITMLEKIQHSDYTLRAHNL